jgi:hypothetical protein
VFDLASILKLLPAVGPVVATLPEFRKVYNQIVATFNEKDQSVLIEAYGDLIEDNDAGHARLQAKLADAANR